MSELQQPEHPHAQISESNNNHTPSQIAEALQREHPEWVSEIVKALGETTVIVPREHIVEAVQFPEDGAGPRLRFAG